MIRFPSIKLSQTKVAASQFSAKRTIGSPAPNPAIVLLDLGYPNRNEPSFTYSVAALQAGLKNQNINVKTIALPVNRQSAQNCLDRVKSVLMESSDSDIGIGLYIWNLLTSIFLLEGLELGGRRVVAGGPMITYAAPKMAKQFPMINYFAFGYAEQALATAYASNWQNIPQGIYHRDNLSNEGRLEVDSALMQSFDSQPFKEYIEMNRQEIDTLGKLYGSVKLRVTLSQLGCPFKCSFCQFPGGESQRVFLPNRVDEVAYLGNISKEYKEKGVILDISVNDATFNSGPYYLNTLDLLITNQFQGKLSLQVRPEMITTSFLERVIALRKLGAIILLEIGLQTMIKEEFKLIHRTNNLRKIEQSFNLVHQYETKHQISIPIEVSLIYGLPGQTVSSYLKTLEKVKELTSKLDFGKGAPIVSFPLAILPGTPLERNAKKFGIVTKSLAEFDGFYGKLANEVKDQQLFAVSCFSFSRRDYDEMTRIANEENGFYDERTKQRDGAEGLHIKNSASGSPHKRLMDK